MLTSVLEYARWSATRPDLKAMSQEFAKLYKTSSFEKPLALARSGRWEEGASIAEKHECLRALPMILLDHIQMLEDRLAEPDLPNWRTASLSTASHLHSRHMSSCSKNTELKRFWNSILTNWVTRPSFCVASLNWREYRGSTMCSRRKTSATAQTLS
ncbi:hypothetical protein LB505_013197 [Fusarium chuoi]|nr:hypothetical protein LB505_013197 [Fusarium chuoi]